MPAEATGARSDRAPPCRDRLQRASRPPSGDLRSRSACARKRRREPKPAIPAARGRELRSGSSASSKLAGEASAPGVARDSSSTAAISRDQLLRDPELPTKIGEPFPLEGGTGGADLRRFYRRQMLRIQSREHLERAPIFETPGARPSALADHSCLPHRAYETPRRQRPGDQMMVIALGRLGMREFDLGSDADLVFVIPDDDATTGLLDRRSRTHHPHHRAPTPAKA